MTLVILMQTKIDCQRKWRSLRPGKLAMPKRQEDNHDVPGPPEFIGVDRGMVNIATDNNGLIHYGSMVAVSDTCIVS